VLHILEHGLVKLSLVSIKPSIPVPVDWTSYPNPTGPISDTTCGYRSGLDIPTDI